MWTKRQLVHLCDHQRWSAEGSRDDQIRQMISSIITGCIIPENIQILTARFCQDDQICQKISATYYHLVASYQKISKSSHRVLSGSSDDQPIILWDLVTWTTDRTWLLGGIPGWSSGGQAWSSHWSSLRHDYLGAPLVDHQIFLFLVAVIWWSSEQGGQEEDPTGWLVRSKYTIHDCRSLSANFCALCPSLRFSILKRLLTDECLGGCSQCSRSKA